MSMTSEPVGRRARSLSVNRTDSTTRLPGSITTTVSTSSGTSVRDGTPRLPSWAVWRHAIRAPYGRAHEQRAHGDSPYCPRRSTCPFARKLTELHITRIPAELSFIERSRSDSIEWRPTSSALTASILLVTGKRMPSTRQFPPGNYLASLTARSRRPPSLPSSGTSPRAHEASVPRQVGTTAKHRCTSSPRRD